MGNFLDTPITDKETEVGEDASVGLSYGLSAMQGWRAQMEDDHVQLLRLPDVRVHASPMKPPPAACARRAMLVHGWPPLCAPRFGSYPNYHYSGCTTGTEATRWRITWRGTFLAA